MSDALEALRYLVGCRTHREHGEWAAESARGLAYIAEILAAVGWRTELAEHDGGPMLWAEHDGGDRDAACLTINGHIDVVPEGDDSRWTTDPWVLSPCDGLLVGRGVADMKGGLAALLAAATTIGAENRPLARRTVVHLVADEEVGGTSSSVLGARLAVPVDVLGLEPTELRIAIEEPGVAHVVIEVEGREGHVANRYRELRGELTTGVNAIERAARILSALGELERRWAKKPAGHLPAGFNTIAPGRIHGASGGGRDGRCNGLGSPVITPDYCALDLNVWYLPHESCTAVRAEICAVVDEVARADPWLRRVPPRVTWAKEYEVPPFRTSIDAEIVGKVSAAVDVSGLDVEITAFPAASDVPRYAGTARDCVLFGPGSLAQAHQENEAIDFAQIEAASRVLVHLLTNTDH